jgi:hypothetical protein
MCSWNSTISPANPVYHRLGHTEIVDSSTTLYNMAQESTDVLDLLGLCAVTLNGFSIATDNSSRVFNSSRAIKRHGAKTKEVQNVSALPIISVVPAEY